VSSGDVGPTDEAPEKQAPVANDLPVGLIERGRGDGQGASHRARKNMVCAALRATVVVADPR
jgi:predicted FMN-binding regulatory protein PaiB